MKQIEINREPLFKVRLRTQWRDDIELLSQSSIEWYNKSRPNTILTIQEEIPVPEFDCEIELTNIVRSNCYVRHDYHVKSKQELTDEHLDCLRAWGCFMNGQRRGHLIKKTIAEDGVTNIYHLMSECDSSD
jgi:hypothetical protein